MADSDLAMLSVEWQYHLRAKHLSPATIRSYTEAVRLLDEFLVAAGVTTMDNIDRRDIEKFLIAEQERVSPGTVLTRFRALRVFFNHLVDDDELEISPMSRMKEPRGERKSVGVPADADISRMLAAINGKTFNDLRDLALLRFMFGTAVRIGEAITLRTDSLDLVADEALVYGKGRKERRVGFGEPTHKALRKYLQARRTHEFADLEFVFIGQRGQLSYNAAYRIVRARGEAVGLRLHPHQSRHWYANAWIRDGKSEADLKQIGGWESDTVMRRYGQAVAGERARAVQKRDSPGDRL